MPKVLTERQYSASVLADVIQAKGSLATLAPLVRTHPQLNAALVQELCYGVCRWYYRLQHYTQSLLEKPLRAKDTDIYCLILLGLYQLNWMRIPAHAAIFETVAVCDALGKPWASKLVNAVLREAQRTEEALVTAAKGQYDAWYSHPPWLLDRIKQDWPADYRAVLDANNDRAPMTLRVNRRRTDRTAYMALLQASQIHASPGELTETAVVLANPAKVEGLPGFYEGLFSVQDEASQLASTLLPLAPGLAVLDACAAPGGKTCALLEAEPGLQLVAADREPKRLTRIGENLQRLELQADVRCLDITQTSELSDGSFARILLDVPCSSTGVIRRHPDIKLLRTPAEVDDLVERQAALLDAAWNLLAPDGYLLYSTCSILKAENSEQIGAFLARQPAAREEAIRIPGAQICNHGLQLLPRVGQQDGFYYALLRK